MFSAGKTFAVCGKKAASKFPEPRPDVLTVWAAGSPFSSSDERRRSGLHGAAGAILISDS